MQTITDEVKHELASQNEEFRTLLRDHHDHEKRLAELASTSRILQLGHIALAMSRSSAVSSRLCYDWAICQRDVISRMCAICVAPMC